MTKSIDLTLTEKQEIAWEGLRNHETIELLFGGGAGGGKTRFGCMWVIYNSLRYKRTRWVIAREVLKRLKETTLVTFFEVCRLWGLESGVDYVYNQQNGTITFRNGSVVLLKELFYYPTDPNYESLGSLEITGAFVDEISQVRKKGYDVLKTRCGRWLNEEYGIPPKILSSCNPSKGWVYRSFYKPFKAGTLSKKKMFIQALVGDNPLISSYYVDNLNDTEDPILKARLLKGEWEYADDPACIFERDAIADLFTNKAPPAVDDRYITGDISRKGRDRMVIGYWEGLQLMETHVLPYEIKKDTAKSSEWIRDFAIKKGVRRSRIALDEDGVGGGVVDNIRGCIGFVNNSRPIKTEKQKRLEKKQKYLLNFANLKTQCYYKLAQLTNAGNIGINEGDSVIVELMSEELGAVKKKDVDGEGKIAVEKKDKIKEAIGRSPDFSDMIMIRMYFELKKTKLLKPIFIQ